MQASGTYVCPTYDPNRVLNWSAVIDAATPTPTAACDISGAWDGVIGGDFRSIWTFTPTGAGQYRAQESGAGSAYGTAALTGSRLQIDWGGGWTGRIMVDLDASCTFAAGTNTFLTGDIAGTTRSMTLQRAR